MGEKEDGCRHDTREARETSAMTPQGLVDECLELRGETEAGGVSVCGHEDLSGKAGVGRGEGGT